MGKIRVCCFCEKWESGGIESFLNNVFHNIDLSCVQIDIVVSEQADSIFTEPLKQLGIRFYELSGKQNSIRKNCKMIRTVLQNGNYDVLYLNIFHALSLVYAKIAHSLGIPQIIAHSHNTALRKSHTRFLKKILHKLSSVLFSKYVTDCLACSEIAAEFMFPAKVLENNGYNFIPNGIKTEKFTFDREYRNDIRRELKLENTFVIGCVGRLCEQKNQLFLLEVLAEAVKEQDCRLLLVGEGEYENILRNKAKELQLTDKVIFYGVSDEVNRLMCSLDCLAMPSLFEGLGIVAIEAQCLGVPVVCSENIPGEALITKSIKSLAINKGAKEWARAIFSCEKTGTYAERNLSDIKNAGFDVKSTAAMIQNLLLKGTVNGE